MNNKSLGLMALTGAPFFLLSTYLQPLFPSLHEQQFYGIWGAFYLSAWMCSIIGLQRLQAAGKGRFGTIVLWVQLGALTLAVLSNVYQIILPGSASTLFFVLDAFWPISNLLMLMVGIAVIKAKRLQSWRRYVPLLVGCWFPVLIICMNVFGRDGVTGTISGYYSAIAWSLMAIAILTAKKEVTSTQVYQSAVAFS